MGNTKWAMAVAREKHNHDWLGCLTQLENYLA